MNDNDLVWRGTHASAPSLHNLGARLSGDPPEPKPFPKVPQLDVPPGTLTWGASPLASDDTPPCRHGHKILVGREFVVVSREGDVECLDCSSRAVIDMLTTDHRRAHREEGAPWEQ